MSGAVQALVGRSGGHPHTIGIGGTDPYGYLSGSFGTCTPGTFSDHGATSRTINALVYATGSGALALRISGTPGNSDTIFTGIIVKGVYYSRASASFTDVGGGIHQWAWTPGSAPFGTSGTFVVIIL